MKQEFTRIAVKVGSNVLARRDGTLDSVISSMKNTMLRELQLMVNLTIYRHSVFLQEVISPAERMKKVFTTLTAMKTIQHQREMKIN